MSLVAGASKNARATSLIMMTLVPISSSARTVGREEAIHLPVVELLSDEPASIGGVFIIPFIDVYPSGPYDLPFASQGLMPGYILVYPFIVRDSSEVCDLLRAGLDNLPRIELHAREIVPGQG